MAETGIKAGQIAMKHQELLDGCSKIKSFSIYPGSSNINPNEAAHILKCCYMEGQRRIYDHQVRILSEMMRNGEWIPNDQITFCQIPGGKILLVNGYHRMMAVMQSGETITFDVRIIQCKDMDEARRVYITFDTSTRKRTDHEVLNACGIVNSQDISSQVASAVFKAAPLIANRFKAVNYQNALPEFRNAVHKIHLAKDYWTTGKIYEGHLSSATSKHKCKMLNVGNTAVALITIRDQPELAEKFWTGVASMEKLEIGDPRMTLAKAIDDGNIGCCIVKDGLTPPHAVAAALAWNAFFSGKTLKAIRSGSSNFFILGTRFSRPSRA